VILGNIAEKGKGERLWGIERVGLGSGKNFFGNKEGKKRQYKAAK